MKIVNIIEEDGPEVNIEQSMIDDLKVLHGIDAIEEINSAILKDLGVLPIINVTNNGDNSED